MVGLMINTVPVRVKVEDGRPLPAWLADLPERRAEAAAFEHLPLDGIAGAVGLTAGELFDSLLVFDNYPVSDLLRSVNRVAASQHQLAQPDIVASPTEFPLRLDISQDDEITLSATFQMPSLDHAGVRDALDDVVTILVTTTNRT